MRKLICLFIVAVSIASILSNPADAARRRKRCKRGGCSVQERFDAPLNFADDVVRR